jgi:hypothetical protein
MDRPHTDSAGIARAGTTPCTGTRQQPLSDAVSAISHSKVSPWLCRCTGYQIASDSQCGFNLHFFFIEPSLFKRLLPPSPSSHPSPSSLNATRLHSTSPRPLSLVRSLAGSPPIPCSSSNAAPGGNHPPFRRPALRPLATTPSVGSFTEKINPESPPLLHICPLRLRPFAPSSPRRLLPGCFEPAFRPYINFNNSHQSLCEPCPSRKTARYSTVTLIRCKNAPPARRQSTLGIVGACGALACSPPSSGSANPPSAYPRPGPILPPGLLTSLFGHRHALAVPYSTSSLSAFSTSAEGKQSRQTLRCFLLTHGRFCCPHSLTSRLAVLPSGSTIYPTLPLPLHHFPSPSAHFQSCPPHGSAEPRPIAWTHAVQVVVLAYSHPPPLHNAAVRAAAQLAPAPTRRLAVPVQIPLPPSAVGPRIR